MYSLDPGQMLVDAVVALAAEDRAGWLGPSLTARVLDVAAGHERTEAELVRAVAQCDMAKAFAANSRLTPAAWLAHHTHLRVTEARRVMRCVRVLRAHPTIADALRSGQITVAHVDLLARVAFNERADLFARDLPVLLASATKLTADEFAIAIRMWRKLADDDLANRDFLDRFEKRAAYLSEVGDGRVRCDAEWDEEGGSLIMAVIASIAAKPDPITRPGGQRTPAQRRADAFVDICRYWAAGHNTDANAPVCALEVVIDIETLADLFPDDLYPDPDNPHDPTWDDLTTTDTHTNGQRHNSTPDTAPEASEPDNEPAAAGGNDGRSHAGAANNASGASETVRDPVTNIETNGERHADVVSDPVRGAAASTASNDERQSDGDGTAGAESDRVGEPATPDGHNHATTATDCTCNAAADAVLDQRPWAEHAPDRDPRPRGQRSTGDPPPDPDPPPTADAQQPRPRRRRGRLLTVDDLLNRRCEIRPGIPIGRDTALRLLCDSYIGRVITRGPSEPLDVGRRSRTFSKAQRRAITIRDGEHCSTPGCPHHARECDCHHNKPFGPPATGTGRTDISNGRLLCRYCHIEEHEGKHRHPH